MMNRKSYSGIATTHKPRFCATCNFLKMGDQIPIFVLFRTISTIKDEKSAANFHYIKTVSGKVLAQSIAFRVVSIYWQGVAPYPRYVNARAPTPIGSTCVFLWHTPVICQNDWT